MSTQSRAFSPEHAYALELLRLMHCAEAEEYDMLVAEFDNCIRYQGMGRLVQMPYSPGGEQPLDERPSAEVEHALRLTNPH